MKEKNPAEHFKLLKTRSSNARLRRMQETFAALDNMACLGCELIDQEWRLNLKAIDIRADSSYEREKLFNNMRHLKMDRSLIHGWGLFTTRDIPANDPVIEYTGQLIRLPVVDLRQEMYEKMGNVGSYVFRLEPDTYIDATIEGGPAKFINHSCDPNCVTKEMTFDGRPHIVIYAIRDIKRGEELSYDYKLDYESLDKRIPCTCGSKNCKGWLNWSEKAEKDERLTFTDLYKLCVKHDETEKEKEKEKEKENS